MTPKEKATELFIKHFEFVEALSVSNQLENAKQCALITVDQMILVLPFTDTNASLNYYSIHLKKYLEQVKQEIKNYED